MKLSTPLEDQMSAAATALSSHSHVASVSDHPGKHGPLLVVAAGAAMFMLSYELFAVTGPAIALIAVAFVTAGIGICCA
ncbi:hypothetical protein [Nocardia sp. NRRL S-836]|uniref:hypothetical protein n=1 Tax=Nocardia sp. NRRL S-836 TaxID=1519492 RepID=UPI0012FCE641|nr:hypothetical protein [Nocardia sp. NRRL S-836]